MGNLEGPQSIMKDTFIGLVEPLDVAGDDLLIAMRSLDVIHMPHKGKLTSVDLLVGNTGVIRVELETDAMDIGNETLIVEQCSPHYTIHGIEDPHIKYRASLLVLP